ncbi:ABC transporter substrate-binding protein [Rhizobium dioscoreae]|uniref:ABC transporter substrate-binding protein n=1 Tax=Rhizobium dioscoreae TaxID=2653122 RepID=A0ABQ0Z7Y9_9HYPH|nr:MULTISPECIES: extracellular solute-binding protein [Rhizobium]MCZ3378639.1 ABC transporter substrate-binding protein [Rhizobium sp. AG207R]TWB19608.1 peptide/nickel transport system substrate-binding protein [Rhizobium sp. ERR1071]GES45425.1 ABC transporter substrate-binding protein [Rhizobium dioscoreae]GES51629.1 ABC transporter substrate-binding protein [Rhizobium dioscoreae]GLU83303.1 ABC transporter substrate-binding protein [Rhizobium sp. NBRC 114257]
MQALRIAALLFFATLCNAAAAQPLYGIAMHGDPALPADFKHFPYVNPDVKKGGRVSYGVVGTFDNLNPFILKSMRTTARGMWDPEYGNLVYESLMQRSSDEPFTLYGLLAQTVEWDDNRSFIQFNLNPKARWSDGQPVTPEDVIFTFQLLRDKGRPNLSSPLKGVGGMEKVNEHSVRIHFNEAANRETPLIIAMLPILPKHVIDVDNFDRTTLAIPVGSGPYKIKSIDPGQRIIYQRDPSYWGKDIPTKIGIDNYDEISVTYFLQETSLFEAFKKGDIDVYPDGSPSHWQRAYDFPAVSSGAVVKETFKPKLPSGMMGFVFNTRRPIFADKNVRKGLTLVFDFEWFNRNLASSAYTRTESYWQNSDLSSFGVPADVNELAMLGPIKDHIDPDVLDGTYKLPVSDGSGRDRKILRKAVNFLKQGGYTIKGERMVDGTGRQLSFEIMTQNADQERIAIAYQRSLALLGISVTIRTVDDSQYQLRTGNYDYDMILKAYPSSLSPGTEQLGRWGSAAAKAAGSFNYAGVASPDVDTLMEHFLTAHSAEDFRDAVRSFDRILISGYYMVPLYHIGQQWVARRSHIARPDVLPLYGYQLSTWWDASAQ